MKCRNALGGIEVLGYITVMLLDSLPEVKRLSPAQKYELAGELWEELTEQLNVFEPHPEVLDLLEARYQNWKEQPDSAVSWEDLQRKLGKQ